MPLKDFTLDDGRKVVISKRRGSKNIRLTIDSTTGRIKVSQPYWVPYTAGLQFVKSKQNWINSQRIQVETPQSGQLIGKNHRLVLIDSTKQQKSKISDTAITIHVKQDLDESKKATYVHAELDKLALKALREESEKLLPQRVMQLSQSTGLGFNDLAFKKLKARWGSCDLKKNLTFNIYLIQLPWRLIDYVILHELVHTKHLHHQKDFWNEVVKFMPDAKSRRKEMKGYKPQVFGS